MKKDEAAKTDSPVVIGFKGFDKNLQCKGFQYEVGKVYTHDGKVALCKTGFHFVENPLDALSYYPLRDGNRWAQVEAHGVSDVSDVKEKDSKRVSSILNIKAELTLKSLIDCAVKFTMNLAKSVPSGDYAHSATSGDYAHSATSGDYANSATSGYYANSATSGDYAHSATSGYSAHSSALGKESIAAAIGNGSMAKAAKGNWIVLAEYTEDKAVRWVKTAKVDGKKIKADTYYTLKNGKFVEPQ